MEFFTWALAALPVLSGSFGLQTVCVVCCSLKMLLLRNRIWTWHVSAKGARRRIPRSVQICDSNLSFQRGWCHHLALQQHAGHEGTERARRLCAAHWQPSKKCTGLRTYFIFIQFCVIHMRLCLFGILFRFKPSLSKRKNKFELFFFSCLVKCHLSHSLVVSHPILFFSQVFIWHH